MYCSQCGTEISDNSILCENCGYRIISNPKRETSINNDRTIPKSEAHQAMGKRVLIVLGIILLIVGLLVFIFFFEKTGSDNPTPDETIVPKSPDETIVPKSPDETVVPKPTDETIVPKSPDETVVPKPTDETIVPKSPDETVVPKSPDETVVPKSPSSSSD